VKLRAIYDNSLRGDFQKVGKHYHGRLVELKDNFMEAKNLDGANAVDAEIKKLRETHEKATKTEARALPLDGIWIATHRGANNLRAIKGDYVIFENGEIEECLFVNGNFKVQRQNRFLWKMKINQDNPDLREGIHPYGDKTKWTRLKK
jgi:hypothetical protein